MVQVTQVGGVAYALYIACGRAWVPAFRSAWVPPAPGDVAIWSCNGEILLGLVSYFK